jgi:ABC-2 type transport system permease protein
MTTTAPIIPRSPLDRLRWAVADAWAVTLRDLTHWVHQPATVVVGLLFPVLMVLMFGYLFGGAMSVPGGGDYREFLLPGLFALTMVFGMRRPSSRSPRTPPRGSPTASAPCPWHRPLWSSAAAPPTC